MDQVPAAKGHQEETVQEPQTETEERIDFSILFGLGGKYILFDFIGKEAEKVCKSERNVVN